MNLFSLKIVAEMSCFAPVQYIHFSLLGNGPLSPQQTENKEFSL